MKKITNLLFLGFLILCLIVIGTARGCEAKKATRIDPVINLLKSCGEDLPAIVWPVFNQNNEIVGFDYVCINVEKGKQIELVLNKK